MSHSYPIWNEVEACIYKSSKSYGARETSECIVHVGTSASNSEFLVQHVTTRREDGAYVVFRFGVDIGDGNNLQVLKTKWMHAKTREWFDTEPVELKKVAA